MHWTTCSSTTGPIKRNKYWRDTHEAKSTRCRAKRTLCWTSRSIRPTYYLKQLHPGEALNSIRTFLASCPKASIKIENDNQAHHALSKGLVQRAHATVAGPHLLTSHNTAPKERCSHHPETEPKLGRLRQASERLAPRQLHGQR